MNKENKKAGESSLCSAKPALYQEVIGEDSSDSSDEDFDLYYEESSEPCLDIALQNFDLQSLPGDIPEDALGGKDYNAFLIGCISRLKSEAIVVQSPRGKLAKGLLEHIEENFAEESVQKMLAIIVSKVYICFSKGCNSSARAQGNMWKSFHALRTDSALKSAWSSIAFPLPLQQESSLTFQLLCDRVLKSMIANKGQCSSQLKVSSTVPKLDIREQNAIRYMAGYVAVTLLNRYKKLSRRKSCERYSYFIEVLESMKADGQVEGVLSFEDYTRSWSELIDRGGLYHINDKVFKLMESIEATTRSFLSESAIASASGELDITTNTLKSFCSSGNALIRHTQRSTACHC